MKSDKIIDINTEYSYSQSNSITIENNTRMMALQHIPKNTIILSEYPVVTHNIKDAVDNMEFYNALIKLSPEEKCKLEQLLILYPNTQEEIQQMIEQRYAEASANVANILECRLDIIYRCNRFEKLNKAFVYIIMSKINHSCMPNCCHIINNNGLVKLLTIKDISAGEECCIGYSIECIFMKDKAERVKFMEKEHFFTCNCVACVKDIDPISILSSFKSIKGMKYCSNCGEKTKVFLCSKCKTVGYCDALCQKQHFSIHKNICKTTSK